jgi:hypothetical protein
MDRYSKIVFTVIAGALVVLATQSFIGNTRAQSGDCGGAANPCYVINTQTSPLFVAAR